MPRSPHSPRSRPRRLRDHIQTGARVLFVGINPGLRSAAVGHHFAGYSNRFWKLLYESGLVTEPLTCEQDGRLPEWRYGITNLIDRSTAGINELRPGEFDEGRRALLRKIRRYRPDVVALVGVTLFRALFPAGATVRLGLQRERLEGARVFVLPNPSGRNANFTYRQMLSAFRKLKQHTKRPTPERVITADQGMLAHVRGIGPKKAQRIRNVVS